MHRSDYAIIDRHLVCILPAKLMAMTIVDRLADGARGARGILDGVIPELTKDAYLACMRRNKRRETFDGAAISASTQE